LRPRDLGDEQELAAREVAGASVQDAQDLERERNVAVEILVEGVEVAVLVPEDQRRGLALPVAPAPHDELVELGRQLGLR
jgi:hypothetical protein